MQVDARTARELAEVISSRAKRATRSREATAFATVTAAGANGIWVAIDGGAVRTPVSHSSCEVVAGDRVTVRLADGECSITGNIGRPSVSSSDVSKAVSDGIAMVVEGNGSILQRVSAIEGDYQRKSTLEQTAKGWAWTVDREELDNVSDKADGALSMANSATSTAAAAIDKAGLAERKAEVASDNASAANSNAFTALSSAEAAKGMATAAEKVATNYMDYGITTPGALTIGNKQSGQFIGTRTVIDSDGMDIQSTIGTSLSKFGTTARVGKSADFNIFIDSDSVDIKNGDNVLGSFKAKTEYAATVTLVEQIDPNDYLDEPAAFWTSFYKASISTPVGIGDVVLVDLSDVNPDDQIGNRYFVAQDAFEDELFVAVDLNGKGYAQLELFKSARCELVSEAMSGSSLETHEVKGRGDSLVLSGGISTMSVGHDVGISAEKALIVKAASMLMSLGKTNAILEAPESGSLLLNVLLGGLVVEAPSVSIGATKGKIGLIGNTDCDGSFNASGISKGNKPVGTVPHFANPGTNNSARFYCGDWKIVTLVREVSLSGSEAPYFGSYTWTFNEAFSAPPYVVVSARSGSSTLKDLRATCDSVTATNCKVYISRSSSTATVVHAIAIGKA